MAASLRRASLCQVGLMNVCTNTCRRHVSSGGKECLNKLNFKYTAIGHLSKNNELSALNRQFENRLQRLCIRSYCISSSAGDENALSNIDGSNTNSNLASKEELSETTTDNVTEQSERLKSAVDETQEVLNASSSSSKIMEKQGEHPVETVTEMKIAHPEKKTTEKQITEGGEHYDKEIQSQNEELNKEDKPQQGLVLDSSPIDVTEKQTGNEEKVVVEFEDTPDALYRQIDLTIKGHDKEVLNSYNMFLQMAATGLDVNLESKPMTKPKIHRYSILKSVHVYKKHFRQYENRTYYLQCSMSCDYFAADEKKAFCKNCANTKNCSYNVHKVTGSTASVFLEYIQRNLPEGVAMKVTKHQIEMLPEHLKLSLQEAESIESQKQLN